MNARDKSYDESLEAALLDPVEAAAYLEAVIEMDDPAALLLALRQVAKAHGMAEVARRAETSKGMRASRNREDRWPVSSTGSRSAQVDRTTEAGNDRNASWRPRWARGQGALGEV